MIGYKIRSNPSTSTLWCLHVPFVSVRVTCGGIVAHRYSYAPSRCRSSQYRITFIPHSVSLCNDIGDSLYDGVRLVAFDSFWHTCSLIFCLPLFSISLHSFNGLALWCWVFGLIKNNINNFFLNNVNNNNNNYYYYNY